jgi:hypothetical protein
MLYDFLNTHRATLIARCRAKVARRPAPKPTPAELEHGIPMFLDQLITALRQQPRPTAGNRTLPLMLVRRDAAQNAAAIGTTASAHGQELMKQGFTIDQVVHDYGDLCQAVTELATETRAAITVDEFRTLNHCLDDAIASAVKAFSARHDTALANSNLRLSDERARALLHEMNTHVNTAALAIAAMKTGQLGLKGATGAVLELSLVSMRRLIERSLPEKQPGTGLHARN